MIPNVVARGAATPIPVSVAFGIMLMKYETGRRTRKVCRSP